MDNCFSDKYCNRFSGARLASPAPVMPLLPKKSLVNACFLPANAATCTSAVSPTGAAFHR